MKKVLVLILVLTMMLSLFVGCDRKDTETKTDVQENQPTKQTEKESDKPQQTEEKEQPNPLFVSEEPLELTIFHQPYNSLVYDDEWAVYQKIAELTNLTLKGVASKAQTDSTVAFNTMIAARPLPDIIHRNVSDINGYAVIGAFQPLDELIDEHAPNIKKFYAEHPEVRANSVAIDGNLYILTTNAAQIVKKAWFIRKDWLDTLNLEVPETVDDLYKVLKEFREGDPNGNGEKDEVPIFCRWGEPLVDKLITLFGVPMRSEQPYYAEDGKVKYAYLHPNFKIAMENLSKWYSEGIIDMEVYSRTKARDTLLSNNQGGFTNDWHGSTSSFNQKLADSVPGFNFQIIKPPADINGDVWDDTDTKASAGWGISIDNENPIETIKFFDFWYSEEGRLLNTMGVEGLSYEMVNGEPQYTDAFLNNPEEPLNKMLDSIGCIQPIGGFVDIEFTEGFVSPDVFAATQMLMDEVDYKKPFPNLLLTDDEASRAADIRAGIETYVKEQITKWIMGQVDIESTYDNFTNELNNLGIDELLDIYTQGYERTQ